MQGHSIETNSIKKYKSVYNHIAAAISTTFQINLNPSSLLIRVQSNLNQVWLRIALSLAISDLHLQL